MVTTRRLPSGDILITFNSKEEKVKWAKDPKIVQVFSNNIKVRTREYIVIAHGIRVAIVNIAN